MSVTTVGLEECLQQAYLSTNYHHKSWNELQILVKQTCSEDDASFIVDFLLVQLENRSDIKFKTSVLNFLIGVCKHNQQLSQCLFVRLIPKVCHLKELSATVTLAKQILLYGKLLASFEWHQLKEKQKHTLVEAQCSMCLFFAKNRSNNAKALQLYKYNYRNLQTIWLQLDDSAWLNYHSILKSLPSSIQLCLLWENLLCFAKYKNNTTYYGMHKEAILDVFIKNVIQSKTKVADYLAEYSFEHTMTLLKLEDLKNKLFPAMQKAILRSAEISLSLFSFFFPYVQLDLSELSQDIGKILGTQLHSKDDSLQEEALKAIEVVSAKCFSQDSIEFLVRHLCKVYNGSEGKLSLLSHKCSLLKAIGALSTNGLTEQMAKETFPLAISELTPLLKQESTESILVLAFTQVKRWMEHSSGAPLPDVFLKYVKEFHKSKSATSLTTTALYDCLNEHLIRCEKTVLLDDELCTFVVNSAKNITSSITKIAVLTESLYASVLLLNWLARDKSLESKLKNLLQSLGQLNKVTLFTDRFVAEVHPENLFRLYQLVALLLPMDICQGEPNRIILYKTLLLLMSHPQKKLREKAAELFHQYSNNNGEIIYKFMETFVEIYSHITSSNQGVVYCCGQLMNSILLCDQSHLCKLLLKAFQMCHTPAVYQCCPQQYVNFFRKKLNASQQAQLVDQQSIFMQLVLQSDLSDSVKLNMVKTLSQLDAHTFIGNLVREVYLNLDQQIPQLKSITLSEYEVYLTPEGCLYDVAVVKSAGDSGNANVKRESKLYSYKEQMAELELRKELNSKKKDELDLSKLTKKQEEIYKAQLSKEADIRKKLQTLEQKFQFNLDLMLAMVKSDPLVASIYFKELSSIVVKLFSSFLCQNKVINFFLKVSPCLMISSSTAHNTEYVKFVHTTTHTLIRIYKNISNEPEPELIEVIDKLVHFVHRRTCPNLGLSYDEKLVRLANENRLNFSAFSVLLPLLQYVLLHLRSESKTDYDQMVEKCLEIIAQHCLMRNDANTTKDSLKHPQHLPIKLMLEMLIKFIERNLSDHQQQAVATLESVVNCVNGEPGCGIASTGDIFVLLNSLTHPNELVRCSCLRALNILAERVLPQLEDGHCKSKLLHRVFVAQFDTNPDCCNVAKQIFKNCSFVTNIQMLNEILEEDIENCDADMAITVSDAYTYLVKQYPDQLSNVYVRLTAFYEQKTLASIPLVDAFGRPLAKDYVDHYYPRLAVAYIFKNISELFSPEQVKLFIKFLIPGALADNSENVRSVMLEAGCQLIDYHGKDNINYLLDVFEVFLDSAPDDRQNDLVRKSVIIFMGTLAKHIPNDNPKLKPILSKLVEALSTPSQIVQEAVANCLQYLIPKFIDDAPGLLQRLLHFLFESEIYGERKGAAYGIAGIVKGLGILSLNKLKIMDALTEAIQAKDSPNNREGALFAFEMLSSLLGRLFEPYMVHILPYLLDCFGDSSVRVRQATDDTARVIMSKLSAPGVTLIYPAILIALEDDSWRKKVSSIELLGSMAYCAPKQLSQCLPKIVPKLMGVITDSHPKVQRSAAQALKQIGSVIKNPEIQAIVPTLLEALQDPANKTNQCLTIMLNTKFVHIIDPPSLALIMPVIERAFQNRSTETRKMASQIIGNMYALTKSKDLSPYLPSIIPGLKNSLLDPVPEVRSVTARALGAMVKSLGDEILADLLPWLKNMLISDASSVDRSGAAQGLAEVLGGLGLETLEKFMPEIIVITERTDVPPHVKDGYIMLFIYLPLVFTQHFAVYISQVINPILQALADENEFVRETALRAGQRIVNMYAETAIQLLLPELEAGLFDDNWRIRYSSVQLLGDLLFKIIGVSGKMTTESGHEDDNFGTEQSQKVILETFGLERRNRIFSGLYMGRSDVSLQVRQASLHVWKVVVTNTPRTLREILPVLFSLLLGCLASTSSDRQQIAARTLGDLVRKLGERILPEIIPILEKQLLLEDGDQRQGVCIGLSEIIASTSREMVQAFADSLIPTVRKALFDPLPEVRQAAAQTFDHLYVAVGTKALDEILPDLIANLDHPTNGERTLDSLKNIISFKSKVVLPYLIPKLTVQPVNTRALSLVSTVAGDALTKYLPKIIPALLTALSVAFDSDKYDQELQYCQTVVVSITDEHGARSIVISMLDAVNSADLNMRRAATSLLMTYCVNLKPSTIINFRSQLWRGLIYMLSSNDDFILNQCIEALSVITKNMDTKERMELVSDISNSLRYTISDYTSNLSSHTNVDPDNVVLPGFSTNKGMLPVLNIFKEALLSSNLEIKELGANGYRDVVKHASAEALKPSIMTITGPLLRIVADRISNNIKILICDILAIILFKAGVLMKPFYPQIQVFFMRSLTDGNRSVRLQAAISINRFSMVHPRPDQFFTELVNIIRNCTHNELGMRETGFYALRLSTTVAGQKLSETVHKAIIETCLAEMTSSVDSYRLTAASCLGALCAHLSDPLLESVAKTYLLYDDPAEDWTVRHFRLVALRIALKEAYRRVAVDRQEWADQIYTVIVGHICTNKVPLIIGGIKCAAYIIDHCVQSKAIPVQTLLTAYARGMNHSNNDVKQAVASSVIFWSSGRTEIAPVILRCLVPLLVNGTKEKNTAVRANSEMALISLLKLKNDDSTLYNKCLKCLDKGAAESLEDCVQKIKKNISKCDFKEEEFDDTMLSMTQL